MKNQSRPVLHPEFLTKHGKKEFAVLAYEEFLALQEWMEDAEDLLDLRVAKREEGDEPGIPSPAVKRELGM